MRPRVVEVVRTAFEDPVEAAVAEGGCSGEVGLLDAPELVAAGVEDEPDALYIVSIPTFGRASLLRLKY